MADALWELGVAGHMDHEIKPFFKVKIVGPAVTVREELTTERVPPSHALELIDNSRPGSVIVIAIDGFRDVAVWGGLMTAGAAVNGLEGAVLDGGVRDVEEIERDFGFPVFARASAQPLRSGVSRLWRRMNRSAWGASPSTRMT